MKALMIIFCLVLVSVVLYDFARISQLRACGSFEEYVSSCMTDSECEALEAQYEDECND